MRRIWVYCGIVCLAFGITASADEKRYRLEVFDRQSSVYEIPIEVPYEGDLEIVADWPGSRTLSLRLDAPDNAVPSVRKSGPSPIRLKVPVPSQAADLDGWKLTVRALPTRGDSVAVVSVRTPQNPIVVAH